VDQVLIAEVNLRVLDVLSLLQRLSNDFRRHLKALWYLAVKV
jgi:hypothetical protein